MKHHMPPIHPHVGKRNHQDFAYGTLVKEQKEKLQTAQPAPLTTVARPVVQRISPTLRGSRTCGHSLRKETRKLCADVEEDKTGKRKKQDKQMFASSGKRVKEL